MASNTLGPKYGQRVNKNKLRKEHNEEQKQETPHNSVSKFWHHETVLHIAIPFLHVSFSHLPPQWCHTHIASWVTVPSGGTWRMTWPSPRHGTLAWCSGPEHERGHCCRLRLASTPACCSRCAVLEELGVIVLIYLWNPNQGHNFHKRGLMSVVLFPSMTGVFAAEADKQQGFS